MGIGWKDALGGRNKKKGICKGDLMEGISSEKILEGGIEE
jgi:hypothetical protein